MKEHVQEIKAGDNANCEVQTETSKAEELFWPFTKHGGSLGRWV
jgi:hypothetical protein